MSITYTETKSEHNYVATTVIILVRVSEKSSGRYLLDELYTTAVVLLQGCGPPDMNKSMGT